MPQQQTQDPNQPSDSQLAAMLGYITTISGHMLKAQQPTDGQNGQPTDGQQPQSQQSPQTQTDLNQQPTSQAQPPQPQPDPNAGRIDKIEQDITSLRDEMKKTIHEEVGGIRELVKEALSNEPG